jgi:aryl-alcohol dehydrogenase-like predicted oxidoreductase
MRYRALGNTGMSVSAVALMLDDSPTRTRTADWVKLIYEALEIGVNAFEVTGRHPSIAEAMTEVVRSIERRLLFVSWRFGATTAPNGAPVRDFSPEGLKASIDSVLARTGLGYLDAGLLDDPCMAELPPNGLEAMKEARDCGQMRLLGAAGRDDAIDFYIATGAFDMISTPFNLLSGWKERLRLKAAIERDMAVMGYDYFPDAVAARVEDKGKAGGWGRRAQSAASGGYAFLDDTRNWEREDICMAYALTEPSMASVLVSSDRIGRLEALAAVPDRDLPPGVGAQIEMARFTPEQSAKARRA